ncbi:unnamed protein product, partial [Mycena citricolor]
MTMSIISLLPSIDGFPCSQYSSALSIFSRVLAHVPTCSTLFPIHAPKHLTGSPSLAIFTCSGIKSMVPIGIISVLFMLNLAPDALHHLSIMSRSSPKSSSASRYTAVSSANSVAISLSTLPFILIPFSLDWRSDSASGSIARLNSRHESGSPWRTPRVTLNGLELF